MLTSDHILFFFFFFCARMARTGTAVRTPFVRAWAAIIVDCGYFSAPVARWTATLSTIPAPFRREETPPLPRRLR